MKQIQRVIQRLYVHNFRCLENFELRIGEHPSVLLIGKNGSGKSTVGFALELLQRIARGTNRVGELVKPKDFTSGREAAPMRFEILVGLDDQLYEYKVAFEYPEGFRELRVFQESLSVAGRPVFTREVAQVQLFDAQGESAAGFMIDWHLVALPIVQEKNERDPLFLFRQWLARMLILRPIPGKIFGDSKDETLLPNAGVENFGSWFTGLLALAPSAYGVIDGYLRETIPDLKDIKNPLVGTDTRSLTVQFSRDNRSITLPFGDLSDGEKCFMITALALASNQIYGPLLCYWDEPDNFLALDEVGHFLTALRKGFGSGSQLIATSHNPEAIRRFSEENTLLLHRQSHLDPVVIRPISDLRVPGDLIGALIRGDVEP